MWDSRASGSAACWKNRVIRKVTVILNPEAGSGDERRLLVARTLSAEGVEARVVHAHGSAELERLARGAGDDGPVVAGGGDGTVSAVAAVLAGTEVPMGILPLGTLNHFAKDLGVPLELEAAARAIARGRVTKVDVCEVNGRIFVNNSSLGLYPALVRAREMEQRTGYGKWPAFFLASLAALRRYPFLHLRLSVDRKELVRTTPLVFIGNNIYQMEGLRIGMRASLTDGQMCVYVLHRAGRLGLLRLAASALAGRLHAATNFDALCAREVWIESRRPHIAVALDGEVWMMQPPLHYRVRPGALRMIVP